MKKQSNNNPYPIICERTKKKYFSRRHELQRDDEPPALPRGRAALPVQLGAVEGHVGVGAHLSVAAAAALVRGRVLQEGGV